MYNIANNNVAGRPQVANNVAGRPQVAHNVAVELVSTVGLAPTENFAPVASPVSPSWRLSPSDFAFLWEECPRCFYLKVVRNIRRPKAPFPKIFTAIDLQMKACLHGKRSEEILPTMPPGAILDGEHWLQSRPITLPGRRTTCYIRGIYDTLVRFDDGSYGVIDLKTIEPHAAHVPLYGRQLHAYAHALENPAPGEFGAGPVSRLGLLMFAPSAFSHNGGSAALNGGLTWLEIARDEAAFVKFLDEVIAVLELPEPPPPAPSCEWCCPRTNV